MAGDNTTTGTTDQGATGTGTAPTTGTGTAQGPATGTAQGQASGTAGAAGNRSNGQDSSSTAAAELEAARARIRELEQANMTDQQRREARLAELEAERNTWEAERQTMRLRDAAYREAVKAGAMYPDLVVQGIDPASVQWAKDGSPSNIAAVVANARQAYPALFRGNAPGTADGGAGQGQAAPVDMNDLIRRRAGRA